MPEEQSPTSKSNLTALLAVAAFVLAAAALIWSVKADMKANQALDTAKDASVAPSTPNNTQTNQDDLMRGTGQPPTVPPTQR